jgi:hypothetical protein
MPDLTGAATLSYTPVEWVCPNCDLTDWTAPWIPNRMHTCPGLHMLTAPLVRAGTRCKVEALERQDWQGREITHDADNGKVYMSVQTTRDDGTDCAVLAPCAQIYS